MAEAGEWAHRHLWQANRKEIYIFIGRWPWTRPIRHVLQVMVWVDQNTDEPDQLAIKGGVLCVGHSSDDMRLALFCASVCLRFVFL